MIDVLRYCLFQWVIFWVGGLYWGLSFTIRTLAGRGCAFGWGDVGVAGVGVLAMGVCSKTALNSGGMDMGIRITCRKVQHLASCSANQGRPLIAGSQKGKLENI